MFKYFAIYCYECYQWVWLENEQNVTNISQEYFVSSEKIFFILNFKSKISKILKQFSFLKKFVILSESIVFQNS